MSPFAKRQSAGTGMFNDTIGIVGVVSLIHVISGGFTHLPKTALDWGIAAICVAAGLWAIIHFLSALLQQRQLRAFKIPEQKETIAEFLISTVTQHSQVTLVTKDLSWLRSDNRKLLHWLADGNRLRIISCDPDGAADRLSSFESIRNVTVVRSDHTVGPLRVSRYNSAGAETYLVGRRGDKKHYILSVNQEDEVVFALLRDYFSLLDEDEVKKPDGAARA